MERAVVIANGPSLKNVPNEWLDRFTTFGSNRVFLKYIPTYLAIVDVKMVWTAKLRKEAWKVFPQCKGVFLSDDVATFFKEPLPANVTVSPWRNYYDDDKKLMPVFSAQPDKALVSGGTVTYVLFQLALWKGYKDLLIVGLNHTFRDPRGDHFDPKYNEDVGIPYERENTEDYGRGPGKWFWSEEGFVLKTNGFYGVALEHFTKLGGSIINCTPDTKCPVFPIRDWRDY